MYFPIPPPYIQIFLKDDIFLQLRQHKMFFLTDHTQYASLSRELWIVIYPIENILWIMIYKSEDKILHHTIGRDLGKYLAIQTEKYFFLFRD